MAGSKHTRAELLRAFRAHVSPTLRGRLPEDGVLGPLLQDGWQQAAAAWPSIQVSAADFGGRLAVALAEDLDPAQTLPNVRAADLYLAIGCGLAVPAAIAAFEAKYSGTLNAVCARFKLDPATTQDIRQAIFQKLFSRGPEQTAKIDSYRGRGDLGAWVRVLVVRHVLNHLRDDRTPNLAEEDLLHNLAAPDEDAVLAFLKQRYREQFRACFQQSIASLSAQERNLLRFRLLEGLTFQQLAAIYHVSQVTVFRRLAAIQDKLRDDTKQRFSAQAGLSAEELTSVIRVIHTSLGMSLQQLLEED